MELRNNPSLAQNTVHTLMMKFILDFDIYTFGVVLIKCFGLLLSLREVESMGEWRKKEVVKYSSPLSLFYHFRSNSHI